MTNTRTRQEIAEEHRRPYRMLFAEVFAKYPEWAEVEEERRLKIVRVLERSCLMRAIDECSRKSIELRWSNPKVLSRYSMHCSQLLENIDPDSLVNTDEVGKKIISGEYDIYKICDYTSHQLYPKYSQPILNELNIRKKQKVELKFSETISCPICKKYKVIFVLSQRGGLDELAGISYQCMEETCGNFWSGN